MGKTGFWILGGALLGGAILCGLGPAASQDPLANLVPKPDPRDIALANTWSQTYDRNYLALSKPDTAPEIPPYDSAAEPKADAAFAAAIKSCTDQRAQLKTHVAEQNCALDANKTYALAVKLKDMALYDAYAQTQLAAAAEADASKMPLLSYSIMAHAIGTAYVKRREKSFTDWLLKTYKPVTDIWVSRYDQEYAKDGPMVFAADDTRPPYEASFVYYSSLFRDILYRQCNAKRDVYLTRKAFTQCNMDANRPYIDAIKLRDKALFQALVTTQLALAADLDAGKLTQDQFTACDLAVDADYDGRTHQEYADWQDRQKKSAAH